MDRLTSFEWFYSVPTVTRYWCSAIVACALLDSAGLVTPMKFTYDPNRIFGFGTNSVMKSTKVVVESHEYWRLFTTFVYFGSFGVDLVLYLFFLARYSRALEEGLPRRNRTKNYVWMLFLMATILIFVATFIRKTEFLGQQLAGAVVYLWARRNPSVRVGFLGLFEFSAPYLPWAFALFSFVVQEQGTFQAEMIAIITGHLIFFFEDIFPAIYYNKRPLAPPWDIMRARRVTSSTTSGSSNSGNSSENAAVSSAVDSDDHSES